MVEVRVVEANLGVLAHPRCSHRERVLVSESSIILLYDMTYWAYLGSENGHAGPVDFSAAGALPWARRRAAPGEGGRHWPPVPSQ
jgi:hypothetical protein